MQPISEKDTNTIRALAEKYMNYATLPIQDEKRRLWRALNGLHMEKPMVCIDQMPWNELDVDGSLVCTVEHPYWRGIEWWMRSEIYKWEHLPVDMVLNPYILLPRPIHNTGFGIHANVDISVTDSSSGVVGQYYHNQIEDFEDIEKIQTPKVWLDEEAEKEIKQMADVVLAGVAPYKMQGHTMHLGIWDQISMWLGVETCYIELMDRPEFIHAIMERATNALISQVEQYNAFGGLDTYTNMCHCSYTFSDDMPNKDNPTSKDVWAFGLAQLFSSVSPEITDEFEATYMKRIFPMFGAIYYGCCDRLDDRLDVVDTMPNIRKISCSPWSDRENFAAKLPKKYIMSNKPTPALLAETSLNEDLVRADIRRTINAAKANNVNLELILKDISTVKYDPKRLWRWAEIAMEETSR